MSDISSHRGLATPTLFVIPNQGLV